MEKDPDLSYTDQWGRRNYEYVSMGCDALPVLKGRTPIQCYVDFMRAFRDRFQPLLGSTIVVRLFPPLTHHHRPLVIKLRTDQI